jgi:hypothetical protein
MAIVETVFVASRPDCTLFDASGLKQEQEKRKHNLINVNHNRDNRPISGSLRMVVRSCREAFGERERIGYVLQEEYTSHSKPMARLL